MNSQALLLASPCTSFVMQLTSAQTSRKVIAKRLNMRLVIGVHRSICMYVCMYIISVSSLVAHMYRHDEKQTNLAIIEEKW